MPPLLLIVGLITGTMIGTFGVGGVLLAPLLSFGLGVDLHIATAMSSWSFLFTGIVGTFAYWRRGSIPWDVVRWLAIGIIPGAVLGARVNVALSSATITLLLAALILASGLNTLFSRSQGERAVSTLGRGLLVLLGFLMGFGSALTRAGVAGACADVDERTGSNGDRDQPAGASADCRCGGNRLWPIWRD